MNSDKDELESLNVRSANIVKCIKWVAAFILARAVLSLVKIDIVASIPHGDRILTAVIYVAMFVLGYLYMTTVFAQNELREKIKKNRD